MTFQILALAILLAFYICYFLKLLAQRRRGISTDQLGKGKTGFVRAVELGVKGAAVVMPLAEAASILCNVTALPRWARAAGAVLGVLGVAAFACAAWTMGDSWRSGVSCEEKTELVTGGIYRFSRNPAFLGFDLVYLGQVLMFFSWPLLVLSAVTVLLFHLQIVNVEEDHLIAAFGQEYLTYRRQVNRYFGRKR